MANIITRAGKGAPLSWNEADANFINLNADKVETSILANYSTTVETDTSIAAALAAHSDDAIDAHVSSAINYLPAGTGAVATDVQSKLRMLVTVDEYSSASAAALAAYTNKSLMLIRSGEVVKLICNPTAGDDLQAMANWVSAGHYIEEGGSLYLEIADGLHNVSTYIDITNGRLLDIRATDTPSFISITGATFSNDGEVGAPAGEVYTATVTLGSALPARVVAGYSVGGLNVQGDGGADALNCGMIVDTIAGDRLSFTTKIRSHGVALTDFTTPDATASLGLTPNQLMVPYCCIRANEAGWDGAAREGFINALHGSRVHITFVGISYNGLAGDNDMLFARGAGSEINLVDYCIIAGAGEMCCRSFDQANISANRAMLGGGTTGSNVWQGSGGGTLTLIRTMFGSVSADCISSSSGASAVIVLSVGSGANQLLRTTYPESSIAVTGSRLSRAGFGVVPTKGEISVDAASSIKFCTSPLSVSGSNIGTVYGNPTVSDNTNAMPTALSVSASGGVWVQTTGKPYDSTFYKVGRFSGALDFPSIAAQSSSDLTIACHGAAFNDFVIMQRSSSAEPSAGIIFRAFVSAADTVTVRAYNITATPIDQTAFTGLILVIRAT